MSRRNRRLGFTLIELMIVVVIMGVLAAFAIRGIRDKRSQAKQAEAMAGLRTIANAQETFRAEYGRYLDVSPNLSTYYPAPSASERLVRWAPPAEWTRLGVDMPTWVRFSYATTAGLPYSAPGNVDPGVVGLVWPAAADIKQPWYAVAAYGFIESEPHYYVATNLSSRVHIQVGYH